MLARSHAPATGITGDFFVVVDKVTGNTPAALLAAAGALVFFLGLWFGLTLTLKARGSRMLAGHAASPPSTAASPPSTAASPPATDPGQWRAPVRNAPGRGGPGA